MWEAFGWWAERGARRSGSHAQDRTTGLGSAPVDRHAPHQYQAAGSRERAAPASIERYQAAYIHVSISSGFGRGSSLLQPARQPSGLMGELGTGDRQPCSSHAAGRKKLNNF